MVVRKTKESSTDAWSIQSSHSPSPAFQSSYSSWIFHFPSKTPIEDFPPSPFHSHHRMVNCSQYFCSRTSPSLVLWSVILVPQILHGFDKTVENMTVSSSHPPGRNFPEGYQDCFLFSAADCLTTIYNPHLGECSQLGCNARSRV